MRTFVIVIFMAFAIHIRADVVESYYVGGLAGGKEFNSKITRGQLLKTPIWRLQDNEPPLSPRQADKLATAKFHELLKDTTLYQRDSISLEDMGDGLHWIYVVAFYYHGPLVGPPPYLQIMVLMDGTVVKPKVEVLPSDSQ
jgi:hypothetical protein